MITVVDAKPMSETGFRQEPKSAECPVPCPRDYSKSSNWEPSPLSPSSSTLVQIIPESKPNTKPARPEQNFTVRYNPNPTDAAANAGTAIKPKLSVSSENETTSSTRPVPRPRPRSMVVSRSEPTCLSADKKDVSSDKLSPPARPDPATRPALPVTKPAVTRPVAPKGPKNYHVVGCSIWYDGDTNANIPPQRPPPVKPKPAASPPGNEASKTAEPKPVSIPPDVGRRKPTIIRPTSSIEPAVGPPVSTTALPLQGRTAVTVSPASTAVASGAETNGLNKPVSHIQPSGSNVVGDVGAKPSTEGAKPLPKKRPTIIRMSRPTPSDSECASEQTSDGQQPSSSAHQERSQALPQSSVEVSLFSLVNGLKSRTTALAESQPSTDHGNVMAGSRQPVTQESEDRQIKPIPRSQSQRLRPTEPDLNIKVPPAKPPPPRPQNTTSEEQNSTA